MSIEEQVTAREGLADEDIGDPVPVETKEQYKDKLRNNINHFINIESESILNAMKATAYHEGRRDALQGLLQRMENDNEKPKV